MRYRLVTTQNGQNHVSSVVLLDREEAIEHLDMEQSLHELGGWRVVRLFDSVVIAEREGMRRVVRVEQRSPFRDPVT